MLYLIYKILERPRAKAPHSIHHYVQSSKWIAYYTNE